MRLLDNWFRIVIQVLRYFGEDTAMTLIRLGNPSAHVDQVELIEGPLSGMEALTYAAVLFELGRDQLAEEVVFAAMYGSMTVMGPVYPTSHAYGAERTSH